jgi:hypothetical protein
LFFDGPQGREQIEEEDIYAAMENKSVEAYSEMTGTPKPGQDAGVPDPIPDSLKRAVAVYEAGKVLIAYITPEFEEVARVSGSGECSWIMTSDALTSVVREVLEPQTVGMICVSFYWFLGPSNKSFLRRVSEY